MTAVQEDYRRSLLFRAGLGRDRVSTGRHPLELLAPILSSCTDIAVRTHVPVVIDLHLVLIPMAGADQIMRSIARSVWPDDPAPMEDEGFEAGLRESERTYWLMLSYAARQADARHILRTVEDDHQARSAALAALIGETS